MDPGRSAATEAGGMQFAGKCARDPRDYADLRREPEALNGGWWGIIAEFDGPWHAWRFDTVNRATPGPAVNRVTNPPLPQPPSGRGLPWQSSLTHGQYVRGIQQTLSRIAAGAIEQVNIGRVLTARWPDIVPAQRLHDHIRSSHDAPFAGWWEIPPGATGARDPGAWVVSASPELAIDIDQGWITSQPIKGTAPTTALLPTKDYRENRLVTAALAADFKRICRPDTVSSRPATVQLHPGLVHLVATVTGRLHADVPRAADWARILRTMHPPRSVTGVPRAASTAWIAQVEPVARGPYCGQIGWIDADRGRARLGAGIRMFWSRSDRVHFGAGAGITSGSIPQQEWDETELKAGRLLRLVDQLVP